jgi:DNA-binding PadR family transcriptional regulator
MKKQNKHAATITESCSCAGAKLDRLLQPVILAILAAESLNGYRVGKHLETIPAFKNRKPDISGLYRTIRELEQRGLIAQSAGSKEPRSRVYHITSLGNVCLKRWVKTLINYQATLDDILGHCKEAISQLKAVKKPLGKKHGL